MSATRPQTADNPTPLDATLKKRTVVQGEAFASSDPAHELNTILGSCVATCLFDPVARVGGMNHFLLAEPPKSARNETFDSNYGLYLMELLINEMLKLGANKSRLKGRLYGGASINPELGPIGTANASFARHFMAREGIQTVFEDLEGTRARRIQFRPASGLVRCREVAPVAAPKDKPLVRPQSALGNVELF
ncbi:MAG: chemotaxis protein CheD [Erythrobacter sp.]|uniref:chemotaxis protein CheD n=1 Tax=Erythrobacter sp. TaxID=1042 RepID=UPI002606A2FB|nr:chemotaxis protein CheD [Erythrobacter sp.]MDJ0977117.1 chemotaxis protein CheD [Erythrobacter sp.]